MLKSFVKTKLFILQYNFKNLLDWIFGEKHRGGKLKDILNGKITSEMIKKSVFYEKYFIEERITNLGLIEEILDSCNAVFRINQKEYNKYTRIYADYLCEYKKADEEIEYLYLFLIRDMYSSMEDVYRCCSFFKQHEVDYKRGTIETKLLLIEKIISVDKENEYFVEKFRHPKFLKT